MGTVHELTLVRANPNPKFANYVDPFPRNNLPRYIARKTRVSSI